jgi:DNA-binding NtrC family response regulator
MPLHTGETLKKAPKKILIADDDQAVTNYLMVLIMQTGRYEPVVVNDSRMVPGILSQDGIDLVLLDMDMPGMDGIDILSNIHEKKLDIPIVVLTGVHDIGLAVKAMKFGVFDYLIKPVDDEKLIDVIDAALSSPRVPYC